MKRLFLITLLGVTTAQAQEIRIGSFNLLRGALPPADRTMLDGLGTWHCDPPTARLDRLLYNKLQGQGANLSCGNRFVELLEFPGDTESTHPYGSYQDLARRIREAKSSVLIANMVWDNDQRAPGQLIASAIADLRHNVIAHPEQYPQGMTVRILLGNAVRPDRVADPLTNLTRATNHLLAAGLKLDGRAEGQWRLELTNFRYAAPHSHMKMMIFDGQELVAGGFNISTLHLAPASGGEGLSDLGIVFEGPIARNAVAAFRDSWQLSDELTCPAGTRAGSLIETRRACHLSEVDSDFSLVWPPAQAAGNANVYPLYRRNGLTQADDALVALAGAAQEEIDLLQAQVSSDLSCDLTLGKPQSCQLEKDGLPVWQAIAAAMRRGVKVRLALDQAYPMKFEAAALVRSLQAAVAGSGAEQNLEVRWVTHPMHTKAMVIDGEMAVVGSTNLHFSSFGEGGLSEYGLATSDVNAVSRVQNVFQREWNEAQPFAFPWWAQ